MTQAKAFVIPFAVFMALLGFIDLLGWFFDIDAPFWLAFPKYWVFPTQTLICGVLLGLWWSRYGLGTLVQPFLTLFVAVLVLAIWISPQSLFGAAPRFKGFDPTIFADDPLLYYGTLWLRFLRLVVIVPLIEEIFWRGFLMRYLINERFEQVPPGTFSWQSFGAVTLLFGLAHAGPDFVPALVTGALYNLLMIRTRSLTSCIVAHAITNLLLGVYIMRTGQWGFW
jgi:uncharacterized protein